MQQILKYTVLFLFLGLYACGSGPGYNAVQVPDGKTVILVGTTGFESLKEPPFADWFDPAYAAFTLEQSKIDAMKPLLEDVRILVFMGTWCEDSHRELPKFVKILKATNYPIEEVDVVAMTREKTTPQEYEEGLNITNIPTFIFFKDGEELGRIVEFPIEDLESDMVTILSGKPYKHAYDWD